MKRHEVVSRAVRGAGVCVVVMIAASNVRSSGSENELLNARNTRRVSDLHAEVKQKLSLTGESGKIRFHARTRYLGRDTIQLADSIADTEMDIASGELIGLLNRGSSTLRSRWSQETGGDDVPVPATRTEQEILALAEGYLEKLIGVRTPSGYLRQVRYLGKGPSKGTWSIVYFRTLNAYRYMIDCMCVDVFDQSGELLGFANAHKSDTCPTEIKITAEEANGKALEVAKEYAPRRELLGGLYTLSNPRVASTELLIVNPNGFLTPGMRDGGFNPRWTPKARLAYVVGVALNGTYDFYGEAKKKTLCIWAWIDAATGEVIGGDFAG